MAKIDWRDVGIRAGKTFLQTAGSYLIANLTGVDFFSGKTGTTFWVGLALSAGAAGLSAVWNGIISPLLPQKVPPDDAEM
jgi:hypothetical protein